MSKLEELGFELRHVGINCANEEEACKVAGRFDDIFGFTKKVGNSSVFAGYGCGSDEETLSGSKWSYRHRDNRCGCSSGIPEGTGRGSRHGDCQV